MHDNWKEVQKENNSIEEDEITRDLNIVKEHIDKTIEELTELFKQPEDTNTRLYVLTLIELYIYQIQEEIDSNYVDYLNFPVYDVIIERTNNEE